MKLSEIGKNATESQKAEQAIMQKLTNESFSNYVQKLIDAMDRRIKLAKTHALKPKLKIAYMMQLIKELRSLIVKTLFYKTVPHFIDTHYIDKNTLAQETYYKTITSRP